MHVLPALIIAVLLFLDVAPAAAQLDDPRSDVPIHFGPLYVTPTITLTRLGIDTNVFNTSGGQQSDFTFTVGPRVDIAVPLRRFVFTAETVTDFVYYQQFENQRGVNFDMALRGEVQLFRLTFFVEDSFLNTRARPNVEIDVRARRKENDARAGLNVRLSPKLAFEVDASHSARDYRDNSLVGIGLARTLNRDAIAAEGRVEYAVTPLTTVRVTSEMRVEQFAFSPTRDNNSWSVVPGVEFNPRAFISGAAEVGYKDLRGVDEALPDFSGPVASVSLSYELLGSTNFGFVVNRDVEFSFDVQEPYYVFTGYGASVRHQLTAPLGVSFGMQRFNLGYRQFGSGGGRSVSDGRVDTVRTFTLTLHRRLTRSTEVGFDLSHRSRRSERREFGGYVGLLAGMTMTHAF